MVRNRSTWRFPKSMWLVLALLTGCNESGTTTSANPKHQVSVAAAADLKFAFDELINEFKRSHPNIDVQATFGSSGNFFAQLSNKAPFDLYFSADVSYPRQLVDMGYADGESEFLYALGHLVLWVRQDSGLDVERLGVQTLLDPQVRKIAIANPQHAPYGRAAEAALKHLGVYEQTRERLVLGENIAQTAQFVESGAADVGMIALSLALAPALREQGRYWPVPEDAYPPLEQGSVILNWVQDREATESFRSFVIGSRGRDVLKNYGFLLPGE